MAQDYEPGNDTSGISSSPGIDAVIKPPETMGNLTSKIVGNLTSEKIESFGKYGGYCL